MHRSKQQNVQITTKLSIQERSYLDDQILKGRYGSYRQAFKALLYYDKQSRRTIERMKSETGYLRGKVKDLEAQLNGEAKD